MGGRRQTVVWIRLLLWCLGEDVEHLLGAASGCAAANVGGGIGHGARRWESTEETNESTSTPSSRTRTSTR